MSTTAAAPQQPPLVPPRPSRSPGQDKTSTTIPMVPPRPAKGRIQRSVSPNPDRFAPSPLNESTFAKAQKNLHPGLYNGHHADHIPRSTSVDLPALGEEGAEYASITQDVSSSESNNNPEHTRTVGEDVKLHAPKPSLPAASAKQRVMTVTRTDSDRAASFGIGRPSSNDDSTAALPFGRSLKKKASTTSQLSTKSDIDDEQGIPEIGLQVPMYKNAGDVQAPSPAPTSTEGKNHKRRTSARGNLPPGSYGLHGHGVVSQDKLDQAYYEKHPERRKKEHYTHHHDRVKDFSMSSDDLNKIVRDTITNGSGLAVKNYPGTPSDHVAWQALESASRAASPGPSESAKPASPPLDSGKEHRRPSSLSDVIHVEEPNHRRSVMFSETETPKVEEEEGESPYSAPILADDEVAKDPSPYVHQPAVELPLEESTSRPSSRPGSRPSSRPASIYKEASFEHRSTPLEDVEEYEPLFNDDDKPQAKAPAKEEAPKKKNGVAKKQRFPSADIWEDAPSSVYYTAEVSTPDIAEDNEERKKSLSAIPQRDGETPAQAFARHQEELAEKETRERGPDGFIPGRAQQQKPISWAQHQLQVQGQAPKPSRPGMGNRFPSRDVWEDTPDSLKLETEVSTPQQDQEKAEDKASSPVETTSAKTSPIVPAKPEIPSRPKPKVQGSGDDHQIQNKPAIPERPKPAIPARPVKAGPTSGGLEPAEAAAPPKQKPAVPARPAMGGKIAALQAGFMSDLNRRLQLGPQAVQAKKEEKAEEEAEEKKVEEKAPLSDARKGRARGPQRRAPTATKAESPAPAKGEEKSTLSFSFSTVSSWGIDPEEGVLNFGSKPVKEAEPVEDEKEEPVEDEKESKTEVEEEEENKPTLPGAFPGTDPLTPLQKTEAEAEVKSEEPKAEESEEVNTEPQEEKKSEPEAEAEKAPEPKEESKKEQPKEEPAVEAKSLVTNTAGETILEEEVKKDGLKKEGKVEPVKVEELGGVREEYLYCSSDEFMKSRLMKCQDKFSSEKHKRYGSGADDNDNDDDDKNDNGGGRYPPQQDDLSALLSQLSHLYSSVSGLYTSLRSTAYTIVTSRAVQKTVISTTLLLISSIILYGIAVVAYLGFYYAYLPSLVSEAPIHLQYGYGAHPFGIVERLDVRDRQYYDVAVEITLPRSKENEKRGNWMVVMHLTSAPHTLGGGSQQQQQHPGFVLAGYMGRQAEGVTMFDLQNYMGDREVLYTSARPAILPYEDALVSTAGRLLFLPWHIFFPKQAEAVTLRVGMAEKLMFKKGGKLPKGLVVEVQAGQGLQVYGAKVVLTAQLGGLRWVMYRWKLASFVVITGMFWGIEMGMMCLSLVLVGGWLSVRGGDDTKDEKEEEEGEEGDGRAQIYEKGRMKRVEGDDMSDTERTFPTSSRQPPLKYESSSNRESGGVKKEEELDPTLSKVPDFGLDGDDEEEGEGSGWRDSGIGTSYSDAVGRQGVVKRRNTGSRRTSGAGGGGS
ncbi:hypothetical protein QBC43DRAFT_334387 [Cladorrhinum sp. PSN259]|nr:hypothetical protein QBC43DRAFT_334387 [Cladorrhinum sp. PSN259]